MGKLKARARRRPHGTYNLEFVRYMARAHRDTRDFPDTQRSGITANLEITGGSIVVLGNFAPMTFLPGHMPRRSQPHSPHFPAHKRSRQSRPTTARSTASYKPDTMTMALLRRRSLHPTSTQLALSLIAEDTWQPKVLVCIQLRRIAWLAEFPRSRALGLRNASHHPT
jgi:hypothetical protein